MVELFVLDKAGLHRDSIVTRRMNLYLVILKSEIGIIAYLRIFLVTLSVWDYDQNPHKLLSI